MPSEHSGFVIEIDKTSESNWNHVLEHFDDANIWQTWSYGAVKFGEGNLSHIVLKRHGQIVAAAQLALLPIPVIRKRIAYIKYGPMRRLRGQAPNADVDLTMLRAIIETYVERKRFVLRFMPRVLAGGEYDLPALLREVEIPWRHRASGGTFLIDLSPTAEEQMAGLRKSWRAVLTKARKRGLKVVELGAEAGVDALLNLYNEMLARKKFTDQSEIALLPELQAKLPGAFKFKIAACLDDDRISALNVYSIIGDTGISLYGATDQRGRENGSSYLLDWWVLNRLKEKGMKWYDLGGAGDPKVNVYKRGLAGKHGGAEPFAGKFDISTRRATLRAFALADSARQAGSQIRNRLKALKR